MHRVNDEYNEIVVTGSYDTDRSSYTSLSLSLRVTRFAFRLEVLVSRLCLHMEIGILYKKVTYNYVKASRLAVFTITRFIVIGHCDSVTCAVTFLSSFFIIYYRAMDMCAIAMWTSFIFKYDPGKLAK